MTNPADGYPSRLRSSRSGLPQAAMHLAQEIGWPIFPCRPRNKTPLRSKADGGDGCLDATTHAEQVGLWWERWPTANIGVATGGAVRLLVVDVDGVDGEEALRKFGAMPHTVEAVTRNGRHLYFRTECAFARNSVALLGPHIDTRGEGGYVIAPPSLHPKGSSYSWRARHSPNDLPLAELPAAIGGVLRDARRNEPTCTQTGLLEREPEDASLRRLRRWLEKVPSGLRDGDGRNSVAFRVASRALESLLERDARALLVAWNSGNAEPLTSRELHQIMRSALRSSRGRAA